MKQIMEECSPEDWVNRLTVDWSGRYYSQFRFLTEMITGIVGSGSSLLSEISRFLFEPCGLKHTHKRLSRQLSSGVIDFEPLRDRIVEMGALAMCDDDVIAFDPGDVAKPHAKKMENLYPVHDGSAGDCKLGYEDFSVEAIQRSANGSVFHIPLYQKLINAKCPEYVSQNRQILDAIHAVYRFTRKKGIFVFDRGHDRSRIYEKSLLLLKDMRWVMRLKENRKVSCSDSRFFDEQTQIGILDLARMLDLTIVPNRAPIDRKTSLVSVGWTTVKLVCGKQERDLSLVTVHDRRNKTPVFLLSSITVSSEQEALVVWGYYLDRWAKEEGYRLTKQALGGEKIRTLNWESIQNLSFLVWASYAYICWVQRRQKRNLEAACESELMNFKGIDTIKFRYYRYQKALAKILREYRQEKRQCKTAA